MAHKFEINVPNLIKILGKSLYSTPEVALREVIQNASDSCVKRTVRDTNAPTTLAIHIFTESIAGQDILTIEDNGAGMTRKEIQESLSTIGSSGTEELKAELRSVNREAAERLIGHFGIGLLSAFTIADRVDIVTRSHRLTEEGFRWSCSGNQSYELESVTDVEVGTSVRLYLDKKHRRFSNLSELRTIVKKYADFISFPIYLDQGSVPTNAIDAPWHQMDSVTADYQAYIEHKYGEIPLHVFPIEYREGDTAILGVLYVPSAPERWFSIFSLSTELDVYVSRMFICKARDLLPGWGCFVKGIIDCPSLEPTVSRESLVNDQEYQRLKDVLGELLAQSVVQLARDDPQNFRRMVTLHGPMIKAGAVEADFFFEVVKDIVPFEFAGGGTTTIPQYLEKLGRSSLGAHTTIYYYSDSATAQQYLTVFQAQGVPVIDADERVDQRFLEKYSQWEDVRLVNIDSGTQTLFERVNEPEIGNAIWAHFQFVPHPVEVVSFEPASIPALLVRTADRKRYRSQSDSDFTLYVNARNPVCQLLTRFNDNDPIVHVALNDIYLHARGLSRRRTSIEERRQLFETHAETVHKLLSTVLGV